jgi:hypothetical protein
MLGKLSGLANKLVSRILANKSISGIKDAASIMIGILTKGWRE